MKLDRHASLATVLAAAAALSGCVSYLVDSNVSLASPVAGSATVAVNVLLAEDNLPGRLEPGRSVATPVLPAAREGVRNWQVMHREPPR